MKLVRVSLNSGPPGVSSLKMPALPTPLTQRNSIGHQTNRCLSKWRISAVVPLLILSLAVPVSGWGQEDAVPGIRPAKSTAGQASAENSLTPAVPTENPKSPTTPIIDVFSPSISDRDLEQGVERAWEYRPYRVAVWLCLDGSPNLNAIFSSLETEVTRRSELIDPSGWDLQVGLAPSQYRWRFLNFLETPAKCAGFETFPVLQSYDKLMVVCLNQDFGRIKIRVREFDLQTQQWGPLQLRESTFDQQLSANVMQAIQMSFMPLARVDRVIRKDNQDEVFLQVRAIDACFRTELNAELQWDVVPIKGSPVFIQSDDRFLPVIRRSDRNGKLLSLEPIEFTFLTIDSGTAGSSVAELKCSVESYHRSPLAGRTSKKAEKLALVIRPPQQPSWLFLESLDKLKTPLEGFEIYSRKPNAVDGEANEFLGKTDWQGKLEIPPSKDGMRIILVSRGSRGLKRLPLIPGLHPELRTGIPNDETSLYAEGVLLGLEKEILNLVIQRKVFESDIDSALQKKNLADAKSILKEYQSLESARDFKTRLANEEVRLKNLTQDKRESDYINTRFDVLRNLLNKQAGNLRENELLNEIQKQSNLLGAG